MGYKVMNDQFLQTAESLKPQLTSTEITLKNSDACPLKEGESKVFDFGNHYVGYVSISFASQGSHPDAPALIKVTFGETLRDIEEDTSDYRSWISRGWLQEETVHLDILPCTLALPRRYAFRYVKVEVIAVSSKFSLVINSLSARAVTSAPEEIELCGNTKRERDIDRVALCTLSECMQDVFEDGPKRDRRLWLGDLRLQALANYCTFAHNDLVKRCLYLFAATADDEGRISACVFTEPQVAPDDTFMFDYSLLFIPTLAEYYHATGDRAAAEELLPLALKQLDLAEKNMDNFVVRDSSVLGWCFLDWNLALNKQAGAQAVYIYAAKAAADLCRDLGLDPSDCERRAKCASDAAVKAFYDSLKGLFVSGKDGQVSYAVNVWFVLAGVLTKEKNAALLKRLQSYEGAIKPVTPYMYHYYVQALIDSGLKDEAKAVMLSYWGAMLDVGADTFFELFDPENPEASPYGSRAANSYCHAWSCTPSYFARKYFCKRS